MKERIKKILLIILVFVFIGLSVYLWLVVTVWAISFIITLLTIGIIIYAISRFKNSIKRSKDDETLKRGDTY